MLRFRSISMRLVMAISLTVAAICGTLAAFSILQQESLTRLALDQELKVQYESVIAAFDYEGRTAMAVGGAIAALPQVVDAVSKGDRNSLLTILSASQAALKAQGINYLSVTLPPATIFLRVHDPKKFGDDISTRRKTIVTANTNGVTVAGVERALDALGVFAITPVVRNGKSDFVVDVGMQLGQDFVDRIKKRMGVDVAVHVFDGTTFSTPAATFAERSTASAEQVKGVFSGATLRHDATIGGRPVAAYLGQIKNYSGEPVAVLEIVKDTTLYEAAKSAALRT